MKHLLIALTLGSAMAAAAATSLIAKYGSGGVLTAPTGVGQKISVSSVSLNGGGTAALSCPVTFFGAGTYQWNWRCAGGQLAVNGVTVAKASGTMKLTCSGGGRYSRITCWHVFTGIATAPNGGSGPITVFAKGGANNAPGAVTSFAAIW